MLNKILICDPDTPFLLEQKQAFQTARVEPSIVTDGKSAQNQLHGNKFDAVIIDIKMKDVSSFDFLCYTNLHSQGSKVFFTFDDESLLDRVGISSANANRLGINMLLKKPYQVCTITDYFETPQTSQNKEERISCTETPELKLLDKNFSETPILDYFSGNISVLDLYIKIRCHKYLKIVHKGDFVSKEKIEELRNQQNIEYLYYRTSDRLEYTDNLNSYLQKYLTLTNPKANDVISTSHTIIDQYVDEVSTRGFHPAGLKQGKDLCENIYNSMRHDQLFSNYIEELEKGDKDLNALFLTGIFSALITLNTDWATKKTFDYVVQGALLVDIGIKDLPTSIAKKRINEMDSEEKELYQMHPIIGYNILCSTSLPQQVKQIVYQHHEWIDGGGYPNKISGMRIFPLAKIVTFASDFSHYILTHKLSPKDGMMDILPQRNIITRYDSEVIKAFAKSFTYKGDKFES